MKSSILISILAVSATLASCSAPSGTALREYSALTAPTRSASFPTTLTLTINEPGKSPKTFPSASIRREQEFAIGDQRDFTYPAQYRPASTSANPPSITPTTPANFQSEKIGFHTELSASQQGSLILLNGSISVKEFTGFSKMGGEWGQSIIDAEGRVLADNQIEMPKFASFTTPVHVAIKPEGTTKFDIAHPTKNTTVTIALGQE